MDAFDRLEWDEARRRSNIAKHYLDFADAALVLRRPYLRLAARTVQQEQRWMAIGMLDDVCVAVIYTQRGSSLRVNSMRKARHGEKQHYDQRFGA